VVATLSSTGGLEVLDFLFLKNNGLPGELIPGEQVLEMIILPRRCGQDSFSYGCFFNLANDSLSLYVDMPCVFLRR